MPKTFQLFSDEPNMLNLSSDIHIFGDIHGQYCDLIRFIDMIGLPPKVKFLFLVIMLIEEIIVLKLYHYYFP